MERCFVSLLRNSFRVGIGIAVIVASHWGGLACGSTNTKVSTPSDRVSEAKLAELRLARRRDRRRMRQLEEKMAKLARERHQMTAVRKLRVEKVEPVHDDQSLVVAVSDDGTEIVYVGEAAQEVSVRAETTWLQQERAARELRAPQGSRRRSQSLSSRAVPIVASAVASAASKRESRSAPITKNISIRSVSSDSLGVTRVRLPTVGDALKIPRAREASVAIRGHRPRPQASAISAVANYKKYVAALRANKHDEAIAGFRQFVRRYPRSDYADNAQYWLGEAYYDRHLYKQALTEFSVVARRYPQGNKVPDAELKAAFCKLAMGDIPGGTAHLRGVLKEFAGTRPAQLAEQKLEHLSQ